MSPRRFITERGAQLVADLMAAQPLEVAVGLRRSPEAALERSAAGSCRPQRRCRPQMPALVDLGAPPSSGDAIATTIAAASCLEGM
jgi:hypothetical protein